MPNHRAPSDKPVNPHDIARRRIRAWMRATGTTQIALSRLIHCEQSWLSKYLGGKLDADLSTLYAIAGAFGHSISALLEAPSDPTDRAVLEAFHTLRPEARAIVLRLLLEWSQR